MKKLGLILMAGLFVLGLAQCKKADVDNEGEKVSIILKMADRGQKANVNPDESGAVAYAPGDQIVVAYDGKYVGLLSYDNASGNFINDALAITPSETEQPLYFYFLGNRQGDIEANATSCMVDISNQSESYAVLSYAPSNETFTGSGVYSAHLKNQCGLVKFNLTTSIPTAIPVLVKGMNNKVTIDFAEHTFEPSMEGEGAIILKAESATERWAILPVQSAVDNASAIANGYNASETFSVPEVRANFYSNATSGSAVDVPAMTVATVDPVFSVSDYQRVYFSPGNLQATTTDNGSTWTWAFAEHQWDIVGNAVANNAINGNGTVVSNGTVDLFGWSTNYYYGIFPASSSYTPGSSFKDWGRNVIHNPITDTDDAANTWRTPTNNEWAYLLHGPARGENRFMQATITVGEDNYNGLILFPDNYDGSVGTYTYNNTDRNWIQVSAADWTAMSALGAVFLPAAGLRPDLYTVGNVGTDGQYWTATSVNSNQSAFVIMFGKNFSFVPASLNGSAAFISCHGLSVRLVRDAN